MTPDQKQKFIEVLAGVHDFYGKDLSKFAGAVWVQACNTFDVEQVTKALSAHLMDPERGQFMPKPADIVRQLQGTNTDRSLIAWGKTLEGLHRVGAYTSVAFDDGIIHAVIEDMGGWTKLCRSSTDELGYLQKRFCDTYKAYANRGSLQFPRVLLGEHDCQNAINGFKRQEPVLIGDPAKALRVMKDGVDGTRVTITNASQHLVDLKRLGSAA